MNNSDYVTRYNEIHNILHRAFLDLHYLYVLDSLKNLNGGYRKDLYSPLVHICDLLKSDLCLELWKVCFDDDSRANTLAHLKTVLHNDYGKDIKTTSFNGITTTEKNQIEKMRNTAMAHLDAGRETLEIKTSALKELLAQAKQILNELCLPEISREVHPFSDREMLEIQLDANLRFGAILRHGAFKMNTVEESEDYA